MPTPEEMCQTVERRFERWNAGDYDGWRATFAADHLMEEPAGTPARPLGEYRDEWDASHSEFMTVTLHALDCFPQGNDAAVYVEIRTKLASLDEPVATRGIQIFTFNDEGLCSYERDFPPQEVHPALVEAFGSSED